MSDGRTYPARPLVGIGVVVVRPDAVLLVRRAKPPAVGAWSLPGGGQELGETVEACARRELLEETGLRVGDLHLCACVDSIHHDAEQRIEYHYTIIDFCALWQGDAATAGDDVSDAMWVAFADLEKFRLWPGSLQAIASARKILGV